MIEKLGYSYNGERIFDVKLSDDKSKLELREACDQHFWTELNRDQVFELIGDFYKLAAQMTAP